VANPQLRENFSNHKPNTKGVIMNHWSRRKWITSMGAAALATPTMKPAVQWREKGTHPKKGTLPLIEFEPKSMLTVPATVVEKPRFPVIDIHTHLTFSPEYSDPAPEGGSCRPLAPLSELLPVMDRRGLRILVNLTGGYGKSLDQSIAAFQKSHSDRFLTCTEPWWQKTHEPGYPQFQADQITKARQAGARGLKVLKTLGLYLRENLTTGRLVKIDDQRFDPMWEAAGTNRMPVIIHISDPEAFFLPIDRFNERYEELHAHPDWSFYDKDFPSNKELHEARNRVVERHPKTQFVLCHIGDAENLAWVGEWLDRYPNMQVDIGARIGELGRQPKTARKFFEKYQDRILFGTDAVPHGDDTPQQIFGDLLYQIYYRFLETEDEYFDYAPAKIPPQGRWRIYGLGLSENILRKVYYENAARLLGITV
jgi:predicted TIM-barrel fold metal-dependent hydrolase